MSWAFIADSTVATGSSASATPNSPSVAWNPGDLLLSLFCEGFGSHTISGVDGVGGWVDRSPHVNVTSSLYVFSKIATATNDAMPTATWSGSTNWVAYSAAFSGPTTGLTVDTGADRATNSVNTIPGVVGTLTPSVNGCLGIWWGGRNKTSASNGATLSTNNANWTKQLSLVQSGTGLNLVFMYWIQSTATASSPSPNITSSISDAVAQSAKMMNFFLRPPLAPVPSRTLLGVGQ